MKYFTRKWAEDPFENPRVMLEYEKYYKTIEKQIPENMQRIIKDRHDTHISRAYFKENDYVMETSKEIWGCAKFIFKNATLIENGRIEDEWWLYNEIYKLENKLEIHILFDRADVVITCDNMQMEIEKIEYFKDLYGKKNKLGEDYDNILDNEIVTTVINKEFICGTLEDWEQIIFSFSQIYYMKNINIEDTMIYNYCKLTQNEKNEIYEKTFKNFEENLEIHIKTLNKYRNLIKDNDLNYVIDELMKAYNRQDILLKEKNKLYIQTNKKFANIDFNKIYIKILNCINDRLIK